MALGFRDISIEGCRVALKTVRLRVSVGMQGQGYEKLSAMVESESVTCGVGPYYRREPGVGIYAKSSSRRFSSRRPVL